MTSLSSLFYSHRFRTLIRELKKRGVFREEPLRQLDLIAYWTLGPLMIVLIVMLLGEFQGKVILMTIMAIISRIALTLIIRHTINAIIIPCTIGALEPIALETPPEYTFVFRFMKAWHFTYYFVSEEKKSRSILGNLVPVTYESPWLTRKEFDKEKFLSEPHMAFVDPEKQKKCCPYIEAIVQKYRMTTEPLKYST